MRNNKNKEKFRYLHTKVEENKVLHKKSEKLKELLVSENKDEAAINHLIM